VCNYLSKLKIALVTGIFFIVLFIYLVVFSYKVIDFNTYIFSV